MAILGLEYEGIDNSIFYVIYWLVITVFALTQTGLFIVTRILKNKIPKNFLLLLILFSTISLLYGISFINFGYNDPGNGSYFKIFLVMCVPASMLGFLFSIRRKELYFVKYLANFVFIATIMLIFALIKIIWFSDTGNSLNSLGGFGRLGIGYLANTLFLITLYFYIFKNVISKVF